LNSFTCSVHADSEQGEHPGKFTGIHPVLVVGVSLAPLEGQAVSKSAVSPVEPPVVSPVVLPVVSLVEPPVRSAVEFPIGLDDPTLADKVSNTALHGDGDGPSLTYQVLGEEEEDTTSSVPEITIALEGSEERLALEEESTAEAVELPGKPFAPESLPETEQQVEPVETTAEPAPAPLAGFGAFMVVALLPSFMAAGAWHYSTLWGQNPSQISPAAGVIGLLLSWLWIRWKYLTR
jgi:hypothetical protein